MLTFDCEATEKKKLSSTRAICKGKAHLRMYSSMRAAPRRLNMRFTIFSVAVAVVLLLVLAAALAPRPDSTFIQEQQHHQHHQPEQAAWELGHHGRSKLSAPADPMVCPSKPQGVQAPKC